MMMMVGSRRPSIFRFSLFSTCSLCSGVMLRMISGGTILLGCWPVPLALLLDASCEPGRDVCSASFSLSAMSPMLNSRVEGTVFNIAAVAEGLTSNGKPRVAPQT